MNLVGEIIYCINHDAKPAKTTPNHKNTKSQSGVSGAVALDTHLENLAIQSQTYSPSVINAFLMINLSHTFIGSVWI